MSQHTVRDIGWGTALYTAGYLSYLLAQWLITVLVVRLGSYEDGGVLSLAISLSNFFYTLCTFGLRNFQVSDTEHEYSVSAYLSTRLFTCSAGMAACVAFVLMNPHHRGYSGLCIVLYMAYRLSEAWADGLAAEEQKAWRMDRIAVSFFLRATATLGGFILMMVLSHSLPLALSVMAVLTMLVVLLYDRPFVKQLTKYRLRFDWTVVWPLLKHAWPLMVNVALLTAMAVIPRYVLEACHGSEVLGYYAAVATPAVIVQAGCNFIYSPLVAPLSEQWHAGDIRAFGWRIGRIVLILIALILLALGAAALAGKWALSLIFDDAILAYSWLLPHVLISAFLISLIYFFDVPLTIMRRIRPMTAVHIVAVIAMLSLSLVLIPRMGMAGVNLVMYLCAGGDAAALGIMTFLSIRKARKEVPLAA